MGEPLERRLRVEVGNGGVEGEQVRERERNELPQSMTIAMRLVRGSDLVAKRR
jgi:hypothetical protein